MYRWSENECSIPTFHASSWLSKGDGLGGWMCPGKVFVWPCSVGLSFAVPHTHTQTFTHKP